MTIPQEAIQDGAKNLLARGTIVSELRQAKGGWVAAGHVIQEEFLDMSRAVLTAALPALERQIREYIAREIEAKAPLVHYPHESGYEKYQGMKYSAQIARGKDQP